MIKESTVETIIADMIRCFGKSDEFFSRTRDIFTARVQSFVLETGKYLEAAIIGEIGNNTFDHNLGFSNNYPGGVYCNVSYEQRYTVLADYGRGVRESLLSVLPSISSDLEAIEIAFTKRISGRSPEQRGNGLKFVSETIQQNNWNLYFQSGLGCCIIDGSGIRFLEKTVSLTGCLAPGCLAIVDFIGDT